MRRGAWFWLMLLVGGAACGAKPASPNPGEPARLLPDPQVVVIFADVTSSLTIDQNRKVAELTREVVLHLPPLTEYAIYLIQADADEEPVGRGMIRSVKGPDDREKRKAELLKVTNDYVDKIEDRYCEINASRGEIICRNKKISPRPQPDHRSCILGVIESVARTFLRDERRRPIDLVFISDMVEDCDDTPLQQSIRLINENLSADITNIERFREVQSIPRDVRITVVRPHVQDGVIESSARKRGLEAYWKKAFVRFGVSPSTWWFESTLPSRFGAAPSGR